MRRITAFQFDCDAHNDCPNTFTMNVSDEQTTDPTDAEIEDAFASNLCDTWLWNRESQTATCSDCLNVGAASLLSEKGAARA